MILMRNFNLLVVVWELEYIIMMLDVDHGIFKLKMMTVRLF
jgi:hypothetical protein